MKIRQLSRENPPICEDLQIESTNHSQFQYEKKAAIERPHEIQHQKFLVENLTFVRQIDRSVLHDRDVFSEELFVFHFLFPVKSDPAQY